MPKELAAFDLFERAAEATGLITTAAAAAAGPLALFALPFQTFHQPIHCRTAFHHVMDRHRRSHCPPTLVGHGGAAAMRDPAVIAESDRVLRRPPPPPGKSRAASPAVLVFNLLLAPSLPFSLLQPLLLGVKRARGCSRTRAVPPASARRAGADGALG